MRRNIHPLPEAGAAIRALRQRIADTRADLADRVHVDVRTVGRWERGERLPRATQRARLLGLAREFGYRDAELARLRALLTPTDESASMEWAQEVPLTINFSVGTGKPAAIELKIALRDLRMEPSRSAAEALAHLASLMGATAASKTEIENRPTGTPSLPGS